MAQIGRNPSSEKVAKLIQLLAEQHLSGTEIAETLWLASKIEPETAFEPQAPTNPNRTNPVAPPVSPTFAPPAPPPPQEKTQTEPRANLATAPKAGVLPAKTLPVWLADPSMLGNPLEIVRALQPLLAQVEAGVSDRLDEAATVEGIARTQMCLPVMESETEPWFDVILVVDRGTSMHLWQRLVKDLAQIFRRYGAFRDLQVFDIDFTPRDDVELTVADGEKKEERSTEKTIRLKAHPRRSEQRSHTSNELIERRGRRIAMVLSDCVGAYWWDGTLLPMLSDWAKVMPTVVWQVLPAWMWERTALGRGRSVLLRNDKPGAVNGRLQRIAMGRQALSQSEQKLLPVPVVTSAPVDLRNWSLMLWGNRQEQTPGFLLPRSGGIVPVSAAQGSSAAKQDGTQTEAAEVDANATVQRFLQLSSPAAQRLVMLLAAAPVITLPVMRLIRDEMLDSDRSPLPVAEVFLSGLLQRLPEQEVPQDADAEEEALSINMVQYDFLPQIREALLQKLPAVEALEVLSKVSTAVENRWSAITTQDFRAFLTDPSIPAPEGLKAMRSFGSVAATILETLGGQYATFADELRQGVQESVLGSPPEPGEDFEIPELKVLTFSRAIVREAAPPVELVMDEFTIAAVEIEVAENDLSLLLESTVGIADEAERAAALIEIAPQLSSAEPELIEQTLMIVQSIDDEDERLNVLSVLLAHLSDSWQERVIELIGALEQVSPAVQSGLVLFEFETATIVRASESKSRLLPQRREWAIHRKSGSAYQFLEALGDDLSLAMVAIPAGTFTMGSPKNEPGRYTNEEPIHEVTIEPFFMGRYPITQAQWRFVAGLERVNQELEPDPSAFKGDDRPVERVSWNDAVEFCDRLSQHAGNQYQLPTEAQWEYACRAGTTTPFHFGETISPALANYNCSEAYNDGPTGKQSGETTAVNYFDIANAFGLSSMHGNVWEWCADHWHDNYEGVPTDGRAWFTNDDDANRVLRGGSWGDVPRLCRCAARRSFYSPDFRNFNDGFRICCLAPRTLQPPTD